MERDHDGDLTHPREDIIEMIGSHDVDRRIE